MRSCDSRGVSSRHRRASSDDVPAHSGDRHGSTRPDRPGPRSSPLVELERRGMQHELTLFHRNKSRGSADARHRPTDAVPQGVGTSGHGREIRRDIESIRALRRSIRCDRASIRLVPGQLRRKDGGVRPIRRSFRGALAPIRRDRASIRVLRWSILAATEPHARRAKLPVLSGAKRCSSTTVPMIAASLPNGSVRIASSSFNLRCPRAQPPKARTNSSTRSMRTGFAR